HHQNSHSLQCGSTGSCKQNITVLLLERNWPGEATISASSSISLSLSYLCHFVSSQEWSDGGCKVSNTTFEDGYIICECTHLTNFSSVVKDATPNLNLAPAIHAKSLLKGKIISNKTNWIISNGYVVQVSKRIPLLFGLSLRCTSLVRCYWLLPIGPTTSR